MENSLLLEMLEISKAAEPSLERSPGRRCNNLQENWASKESLGSYEEYEESQSFHNIELYVLRDEGTSNGSSVAITRFHPPS